MKRLDRKLATIRGGLYRPTDFVIADAKDADMSFGCAAPGVGADGRLRPATAYREDMVRMVRSGLVDILLTSLGSAELLQEDGVFDGSDVTPAVRMNDTTDIWHVRGGSYTDQPMRSFRTARLDRVRRVAQLGLYSVTFFNDLDRDLATLEAYGGFRDDASSFGVRHFLEVFNPQVPVEAGGDFAAYNNDMIVRCLAGVARQDRPIFLKAVYNGPAATEEIAGYDPKNLIFGILGGQPGTARDTLELIRQAEKYGARVALFGRKLQHAEDAVLMVRAMRRVIEDRIDSAEGVRSYHADLVAAGIRPRRSLEDDMVLSDEILRPNLG